MAKKVLAFCTVGAAMGAAVWDVVGGGTETDAGASFAVVDVGC